MYAAQPSTRVIAASEYGGDGRQHAADIGRAGQAGRRRPQWSVGGLLLTMLVNVPMNGQLAATAIPPSVDEARAVWENYFGRWQTYNQLRSAACGLSLLLLAAVALRLLGPSGSHRHRLARPARDDSE